ncbi:MAG: RHS repeat-associated core domain-containing protein [archaeon]
MKNQTSFVIALFAVVIGIAVLIGNPGLVGQASKTAVKDLGGDVSMPVGVEPSYRIGESKGKEYYVYGSGLAGKYTDETGMEYYHSDHLGSTRVTTDIGGWKESSDYKPYGEPMGTSEARFGYTGKEQDITGLKYYGARYYDPEIGRFITVDPIKDGMNFYVYANNNPMRFIDPTGLYDTDAQESEVTDEFPKHGQVSVGNFDIGLRYDPKAHGSGRTDRSFYSQEEGFVETGEARITEEGEEKTSWEFQGESAGIDLTYQPEESKSYGGVSLSAGWGEYTSSYYQGKTTTVETSYYGDWSVDDAYGGTNILSGGGTEDFVQGTAMIKLGKDQKTFSTGSTLYTEIGVGASQTWTGSKLEPVGPVDIITSIEMGIRFGPDPE